MRHSYLRAVALFEEILFFFLGLCGEGKGRVEEGEGRGVEVAEILSSLPGRGPRGIEATAPTGSVAELCNLVPVSGFFSPAQERSNRELPKQSDSSAPLPGLAANSQDI